MNEGFVSYWWWRAIVVALVLVAPTFYYYIRAIYCLEYSCNQKKYLQTIEILGASLLKKKPQGLEQWLLLIWSIITAPVLLIASPCIFLWPLVLAYIIVA